MPLGPPVVLFDVWRGKPVFHAMGGRNVTSEPIGDSWRARSWEHRTTCGLLVSGASWVEPEDYRVGPGREYKSENHGTTLPTAHAERFARRCLNCDWSDDGA